MCRVVRMKSLLAGFSACASISFMLIFSSGASPEFFVGMYARYQFAGDITLNGHAVYTLLSFSNQTVLDVKKNTAEIETEMLITYTEGLVPEAVLETYNPFPNSSYKTTMQLNLSQSYWGYYLNDTAHDLLRYSVGEKTVQSDVGVIQCNHLQLRRSRQEWNAFYDKHSGIVIRLQETFWVDDYEITYSSNIVDTNAHLSVAADQISDSSPFLIFAAVIAIIASLAFFAFKQRRKPDLNAEKEQ